MTDTCNFCGGTTSSHGTGCILHPEFMGSKKETLRAHGWTPWPGGEQPADDNRLVTVVLRNGTENTTLAGLIQWNRTGAPSDIIGWRTGRAEDIDLTPGKVHWVGEPPTANPLDVQVAGGHYKTKRIQPVQYIAANNLNFLEGCIVKRITRWRDKAATDRFEDLHKIKHEIDLLIEMEMLYGGEA